jgi:S1-C subfamily serine protease
MSVRRLIAYTGLALGGATFCFVLGAYSAQQTMSLQLAENDANIAALRDEMARSILQIRQAQSGRASGTDGQREPEVVGVSGGSTEAGAPLIEEIKRQLQSEMGLLPVRLLRERRQSFVELTAWDNLGKSSYGTAGYLGNGYFITVKHGVVALDEPQEGREPRRITRITVRYKGQDLPARLVDTGDANVEVHAGDWAIVKVKGNVELPPLRIDTTYAYEFADPIFRLGNDYSKGIILSTGYVGQRTTNGLVTCLTDGHPGVSGGGVLDQEGDLVGIPIGRMQGDYRFSFILPLRAEMFRKVPGLGLEAAAVTN